MTLQESLRGAVAGGVAAAVWAAQQPLDKRVFRCDYDDVELLGRLVAPGGPWPGPGTALHVQNGALFGAAYVALKRFLPGSPVLRGLSAGMIEHIGSWPLVPLVDRYHPARRRLPRLGGNRRALAQATWRHALFGIVLGALEHRLNARSRHGSESVPAQSNGHGDLERAAVEPGLARPVA